MNSLLRRFGLPASGIALAVVLVAGCGSGASGTLAQQAKQTVSSAAADVQTVLVSATTTSDTTTQQQSTTPPTRTDTTTETITKPAQSVTVTSTTTATTPAPTTSITSVVKPISNTADESSSSVPWWAWLLIGLGAVSVAIAIFEVGRGHRGPRAPATAPPGQEAAPRSQPPRM